MDGAYGKNGTINMWYSLLAYLKFLLTSTNHHGVHSPFVYDLVTKCFYNRSYFPQYEAIKTYRDNLTRNKQLLSVTDLGSGSKQDESMVKLVSQIAQTAGTTYKRAKLLMRLVQYFQPHTILELGTSLGIATQAMHLGNSNSKITSIEGCPNISEFTQNQIKSLRNIKLLTGDFNLYLSHLNSNKWDFVFFDGNHNKAATLEYFEALLPTKQNNSVFIFDDIYWSKGMTEAWELIKQHPEVRVTIDTYFWGFVFFRNEQVKEHFKIRL